LATGQARAYQIVYDPTNYAQNVLTAARALEEIHNQIQQIEQQAKMLSKNPLQLSPELAKSISDAQALFKQAQGIAFDVEKVSADLKALYPETWDDFKLKDALAQSDAWLEQDRASIDNSMKVEAQAIAAIEKTQGSIDRALSASLDAEGQTGAVQAGNQLLGIQASQLAQIQALLASQSRELTMQRAEAAAKEARAKEIQKRAFPEHSEDNLAPARSSF
jgi:P-type conjugative transfer protein TrbJ